MHCEICGRPLTRPSHVNIDGAIFKVCPQCAKLGKPVSKPTKVMVQLGENRHGPSFKPVRRPKTLEETTTELRGDFAEVVRKARGKFGLSQEEFGRRIGEKPSVISLVETGKLRPADLLARKIEHFLRVELLLPVESET